MRKFLIMFTVLAVVLLSLGVAMAGGPPGEDGNPPNTGKPSNPPCDADHGHPLMNLLRLGKDCPPGNGPCPPQSQAKNCESPEPSPSPTGSPTTPPGPDCAGYVALADTKLIEDSAPLLDGVVGVHADVLPGADPEGISLARVCVGLGSVAALGVECEGPVAVEPDGTSGLLICVEI